ncbi:hypothetical protein C3L33_18673, partial [Rhododendron williamsianum]
MLGLEALTGSLEDFGFEDYLNDPRESETFRPLDMHHGMEVRLGVSKGPFYMTVESTVPLLLCPAAQVSITHVAGIENIHCWYLEIFFTWGLLIQIMKSRASESVFTGILSVYGVVAYKLVICCKFMS